MGCRHERTSGENNTTYDLSVSAEDRMRKRTFSEYRVWRRAVKKRDRYSCVCCRNTTGVVCAHHLNGYEWFPEGRTDIDNGVTLCINCHRAFHKVYGKKGNTREQFYDWVNGGEVENAAA